MSAHPLPNPASNAVARLVAEARFEVVPLKNVGAQLQFLPHGCSVSVTCSPAKGLDATLDLAAKISDLGHMTVPHISARLTEDRPHVARIAAFCKAHNLREAFLVAGDAPEPIGVYDGVVAFLRDFLDFDHGLSRIGVAAYPDGHALLDADVVRSALHDKQALLSEAGVAGFASTQMCFDVGKWRRWLTAERANGFELPVHLGVPGDIDRSKLLAMGMRLGIGSSMRYVRKNKGVLGRLLSPGGYDPMKLVSPLGKAATELGIEGLHLFTFNNVEATVAWQRRQLERLP